MVTPEALGGIGFRESQNFNQAMMAKQGWRLMPHPNFLCARVLSGKYYHDSEFLSAGKENIAYYIRQGGLEEGPDQKSG